MFTYTYKALTEENRSVEATKKGYLAWFVRRALEREGMVVIRIARKHSRKTGSFDLLNQVAQMTSYSQILFFRNFSMMLESGISMSKILETLQKQAKGAGVSSALRKIQQEVINGKTLSSAMAKYPRLFPEHLTKTIEVGEQSGKLSHTMDRISVDVEKNYELRRKVIGAIMYPLIIIFFMILTAFLLIIFVLPQLTAMFNDLGAPVPIMTVYMQAVGIFVMTYPIEILVVCALALISFFLLMQLRPVRIVVHATLLRVPIFGPLMLEYNLVRLTRALTTLISSGITFTQAIEASKGTLKNEAFRSSLDKIYPVVLHGGSFSDAIGLAPSLYPEQLYQLILVGEQSGRLGYALDKASIHYERSVHFQTQILTTLIEPILMLVAGVLVGSLAYSMFAPLYQIAEHI